MVRYYFFVAAFVLSVNNVVVATASENATNATTIVENATNATMVVPCYGDRSSRNSFQRSSLVLRQSGAGVLKHR